MPAQSIDEQLVKYLTDLHSTEVNALAQLKTGVEQAGEPQLAAAFREHLTETEEQERLIGERLSAHDAGPSTLKDLAQKGGAMATGAIAKAAPDTTGKLAIEAYAFEHLEIASYRMLLVVARQAADHETVAVAERILAQEEAAAKKLDGLLDQVAAYDLEQLGIAAGA
jgi:ferritin-like metal-binding protein YciE